MATKVPTTYAAAALCQHGGRDLVFAAELAEALGFGWELEELELREINDLLGLESPLPSWLLSTFRDQQRTELVLANYAMTPRHAKFIADSLEASQRMRRLVVHFANFGDYGVSVIAKALVSKTLLLVDLHLVGVQMGDEGAKAIAAAIASPDCSIGIWNLENNRITDEGGDALADACALALSQSKPTTNKSTKECEKLTQFMIGHNYLSTATCGRLAEAFRHSQRLVNPRQNSGPLPRLSAHDRMVLGTRTVNDVKEALKRQRTVDTTGRSEAPRESSRRNRRLNL
jgi:hypothetical protein